MRAPFDDPPQACLGRVPWLVLGLAAGLASSLSVVEGQTIQGRVSDAGTDRPIANALIRLLDPGGEGILATAADSTGRYRLAAPQPGIYRLRAEQLGYEAFESDPIAVGGTEPLSMDLRMRSSPIAIRGVEASTDAVDRRIREVIGMSPARLRIRPIRSRTILDHAARGNRLPDMMRSLQIPNLQVLRSRDGPCYQFRGRGCMPVYLDGARLNRSSNAPLPLDIISTVVVVLPNEIVAYPAGAVHVFSVGFAR